MGRITKHPELQKFAELVQSIPKEGTVEHRTLMLLDAIQQCGIKAVAIDFDYTITTKHTGGGWPTPRLSELTLSTDAVHLAKELNKRSIPLCVVTFSDPADTMPFLERVGGEALVRGVLRENNDPFVVDSVVAMRPDLNTDPTKFKALGLEHPPPRNKSYHIDVVARKHNILATEVILIDDDRVNCVQHFKAGGLALYVTGEGFSLDNIIPVTSASLLS